MGLRHCVQTPQVIRICSQNAAWLVKQKEHRFREKHRLFSNGSAEISLPWASSLTAVRGSKSKVNPVRQLYPQFFTWTVIRDVLFTYSFNGNWAHTILQVLHQVLGKHRWVNSPCAQEAPADTREKHNRQWLYRCVCLRIAQRSAGPKRAASDFILHQYMFLPRRVGLTHSEMISGSLNPNPVSH